MRVSWDDTKNENGSFELPPEGNFPAIIFGIWDVGIQRDFFGNERQKYAFGYEIVDNEGKHYELYKLYTPSLACYEKDGELCISSLRKDIEAIINRQLAEKAELDPLAKNGELDLDQFIGKFCIVQVQKRWNKARTKEYADLKDVFPFPRNHQRFAPTADYCDKIPKYIQRVREGSGNSSNTHGEANGNGYSDNGGNGNGAPTSQRPDNGRAGQPGNGNVPLTYRRPANPEARQTQGNGQAQAGKRHLEYAVPNGNGQDHGSFQDDPDPNDPQF